MATRSPNRVPQLSKRGRAIVIATSALFALLLVGPRLLDVYVDWLWFGEVGFRSVWLTVLLTKLATFAVVTVLVSGALALAILLAYRARPVFVPDKTPNDPLSAYRAAVMTRPLLITLSTAGSVGVLCGLIAQLNWATVQLFLHGGAFGIDDPEFGHDIAFFVFDLPFYRSVLNWLLVATVLAFIANLVTNYLFGGFQLAQGKAKLTQSARIQLAVLAGTAILLKAVAYWFDRYDLLTSGRKEPTFTGAGYTDIHANLPAKLVLLAIAVLCAASFFAAVFLRDMRIPAMATVLLVLSSVLVSGAWPMLMEQFSVRPNAADVERPYIQRNIDATRQAFRLDGDAVEYRDYPGIGTRPPQEVPADRTTIAQIRLLDPQHPVTDVHPAAAAEELLQLSRGPRH